jgi:conjugal transfer pilus assembly protein TraA
MLSKMSKKMNTMIAFAFVLLAIGATSAFAGADATFNPLVTQVTGWMQGSLGTLLALFAALMGVGSAIRGNWIGLGAGVGVSMGAFYLPTIIPTITSGLM